MTRVGIISDTHGLLRPQAVEALRGSSRIVHAGDIGNGAILEALEKIAPVVAVRGNNDRAPWAEHIPLEQRVDVEGVVIHVLHDLATLSPDALRGVRVVVAGHSHRPSIQERKGVLYVNPGSAGPRRFRLPVTVGELTIDGGRVQPMLHELEVDTVR